MPRKHFGEDEMRFSGGWLYLLPSHLHHIAITSSGSHAPARLSSILVSCHNATHSTGTILFLLCICIYLFY